MGINHYQLCHSRAGNLIWLAAKPFTLKPKASPELQGWGGGALVEGRPLGRGTAAWTHKFACVQYRAAHALGKGYGSLDSQICLRSTMHCRPHGRHTKAWTRCIATHCYTVQHKCAPLRGKK
eukprot:scaffold154690_cov21-Tisochrysis_lutea.AAC.1